jgi:hypothetical protein
MSGRLIAKSEMIMGEPVAGYWLLVTGLLIPGCELLLACSWPATSNQQPATS